MRKRPEIAIFILIGAIVGLLIIGKISHTRVISATLTSDEQILNAAVQAAVDGKRVVKFESTVCPSESTLDHVFSEVLKKNPYVGAELHHYEYRYIVSGSHYKTRLKFSKPSKIAAFFTRLRVKSIAKNLNNKLDSDYDKVKAVHDYLIQINKYSYINGGAFNCLYLRSSACNGYASSFFLIMQELGIPCTCEFGSNHEWNSVCVDGVWYNIDVTWDDQNHAVVYDYFLKCNNDWAGHHHGSSDAVQSLPVTGKGAYENFRLIPSYRTFANIGGIAGAVALFFLFRLIRKIAAKAELHKIEAQLDREEQARRLFEEELERKRQAFAQEDHNLY